MYKIRALIVYIHTHAKRGGGGGMVSITNVATPHTRKAGDPSQQHDAHKRRTRPNNLRPIMVVLKPSPSPSKQATRAYKCIFCPSRYKH